MFSPSLNFRFSSEVELSVAVDNCAETASLTVWTSEFGYISRAPPCDAQAKSQVCCSAERLKFRHLLAEFTRQTITLRPLTKLSIDLKALDITRRYGSNVYCKKERQ